MRFMTLKTIGATLVSLLGTVAASAQEPPELPLLPRAPRVDGTLEPEEWEKAFRITEFVQFEPDDSAIPPARRTEAWVGRTDTDLCIAFRCHDDRKDKLITNAKEHDGKAYLDDCVEIFFDAQKTESRYYHLIVNAAGTIYDAWNNGPRQAVLAWDSGARAAVERLKDGYTLEITIPLAAMNPGLNKSGEITLNLGRVLLVAGDYSSRQQQTSGGQFHNAASWQAFRLPGVGPEAWPVALPKPFTLSDLIGDNEGTGEIRNLTDRLLELSGEMIVEQGGKRRTASIPLTLAPKEKKKINIPYTLVDTGVAKVSILWRDPTGKPVLAVHRTLATTPSSAN